MWSWPATSTPSTSRHPRSVARGRQCSEPELRNDRSVRQAPVTAHTVTDTACLPAWRAGSPSITRVCAVARGACVNCSRRACGACAPCGGRRLVAVNDEHRAGRVLGDVRADRTEQEPGEASVAAVADDQHDSVWVPETLSSYATWAYSRIRPPSRSRRRTRIFAPIAGGCERPAGGFCCSVRCGR